MSKSSPPYPNLRQWLHPIFITLYMLMALVYIPVGIGLLYFFFGPGDFAQPIEIEISFQSIILFISMMVPFLTWIVCGYRSNTIQVSNEQEKEEWAVGLESAFKTLVQTARYPFNMDHLNPVVTEELARYLKMDFAQYLANPYHPDPFCLSLFSRRRYIFDIVSIPLLALCFAGIPFKDWSKHDCIPFEGCEAFVQGFGCILVVVWCHAFWEPMWKIGLVLKMGGIARQIRRECIKNGSVKGSEEDVEKSGISVDPRERLKWWIRESWKACEDGDDICGCWKPDS